VVVFKTVQSTTIRSRIYCKGQIHLCEMQVNTTLFFEPHVILDEMIKMGNLLNYCVLSGFKKGDYKGRPYKAR